MSPCLKCVWQSDGLAVYSSAVALLNASIVDIEGKCLVVDSMLRPVDARCLATLVKDHGRKPDFIFNTHGHSDHCFGNRIIPQSHTQIIAHKSYRQTLQRERNMFKPSLDISSEKHSVPEAQLLFEQGAVFRKGQWELDTSPCAADNSIIIHAPGHSPDMSYLYLPQQDLLFAGDNILNSDSDVVALPYIFWGDAPAMINSLQMILDLGVKTIIPGHGLPVGRDKVANDLCYMQNLKRATEKVFDSITETDLERLMDILKSEVPVSETYPEIKKRKIWVPQVHELNLRRLALNHLGWE